MGTPLIVQKSKTGADITPTLGSTPPEPPAADEDVGTGADYKKLRTLCRPSSSNDADINKLDPRQARLVSDVFNHAYQNSDFSPYSGQQPKEISKNLQASAILKMTVGNRGELGKKYMRSTKKLQTAQNYAKKLDKKARELIKVYEGITNQIIAAVGTEIFNNDTWQVEQPYGSGTQKTKSCFLCGFVGSTTEHRKKTNTYIPSFIIPAASFEKAKQYIAPVYSNLIKVSGDQNRRNAKGILGIYSAVLEDMNEEFTKIGKEPYNYKYLPAVLKETRSTMSDKTNFKKIDQDGKKDGGLYAATQVQDAIKSYGVTVGPNMAKPPADYKNLAASCGKEQENGLAILIGGEDEAFLSNDQNDPNALYVDADCDDDVLVDKNPNMKCLRPGHDKKNPGQLFAGENQVDDEVSVTSSASTAGLSAFSALVFVLCMYFQ